MPEDTQAEDRVTHGRVPFRDPAQRRLVEQELISQQNPLPQLPNRLTTVDKAEPPGGRATREQVVDLSTRQGDTLPP